MSGKNPCKSCDKRNIGCHASCADYIDWNAARMKEADKIRSEKYKYRNFEGYAARVSKNMKTKRRKKSMSARRAAIRRERKERTKAEKNKTADGEMLRAAEQGKIDGRVIAFCVMANLLYDLHGFRKKRIESFLQKCNKEATRFDNDVVRFVIEFYADKLLEKINKVDTCQNPNSVIDTVYINQRDTFYVSSLALMLVVLSDDYGMASNGKNSGRLDTLMEYCTNEYIKIQMDPNGHTAEWYVKKTRGKTGLEM